MRLFLSTVRKLIRRPATWVTFGLIAGLLILIVLAVATTGGRGGGGNGGGNGGGDGAAALLLVTFPGAYDLILGFILGLGGLFAVIYGAAIAGSEWTWGTLKSTIARGESRVTLHAHDVRRSRSHPGDRAAGDLRHRRRLRRSRGDHRRRLARRAVRRGHDRRPA